MKGDMMPHTQIMDGAQMQSAIRRLAHQILDKTQDTGNLALIGVRSRGISLAERIAADMEALTGCAVPVGTLDITHYRDDMQPAHAGAGAETRIGFDVDGKKMILVDDVLYTGRTARAAMDAIMDMGRPSFIKLAVLVDRGHRELPIRADFVGKNVPTAPEERIAVRVTEFDGEEGVWIVRAG